MRSLFFLPAIYVCLAYAELSDIHDNNLALGDSNSVAPPSILVADGEEDFGTAARELYELPGYLLRNSQSDDDSASQNPSNSHPNPTPPPEVSPGPVTQPDCNTINDEIYFIAVCCIDDAVPLGSPPYSFWSTRLCSRSNPHFFLFSLSSMWNLPPVSY